MTSEAERTAGHIELPWRVIVGKYGKVLVEQTNANGELGLFVADCSMTDEARENAELIVLAVNSYHALHRQNAELREAISKAIYELDFGHELNAFQILSSTIASNVKGEKV